MNHSMEPSNQQPPLDLGKYYAMLMEGPDSPNTKWETVKSGSKHWNYLSFFNYFQYST